MKTVTVVKPVDSDGLVLRDTDDVLEAMNRSALINKILDGEDSELQQDSDELGIEAGNLTVLQRFMDELIEAKSGGDVGSIREKATLLRDGMLHVGLSNSDVKNAVQGLDLGFELEPSIEDKVEHWKGLFDERVKGLKDFGDSMGQIQQ